MKWQDGAVGWQQVDKFKSFGMEGGKINGLGRGVGCAGQDTSRFLE